MSVDAPLVERDQIVCDLRDAIRDGESGLAYVPRLLRRVLETDAWRERYDRATQKAVPFRSFEEFVTTGPTEGLGATDKLIDRIVGTEDPELLRLLRKARSIGRGTRSDLGLRVDSTRSRAAEDSANTADRLAREAPDEYEAVKAGRKTLNAAARDAGIRRHRVSVYVDDAPSAARALRKHMSPDQLAELARLLLDESR